MKKKISIALAAFAFALLLVVGSVAGTIAYLTSTPGAVTNTFTVGNVTITLDEAKVTPYGVVDGTDRVTENTYKLIPGHTYVKDPTIYVDADSEDCYVFFKVENGLGADANIVVPNTWTLLSENGNTKVYYYNEVANAGDTCEAFTKFTVADDAVVADYATAKIVVTAYAIQADGLDTNADHAVNANAAWTAGGFN